MRKYTFSVLLIFIGWNCFGQLDTNNIIFSPKEANKYQSKKTTSAILTNATLYGGSMTLLYKAWYKNYPQSSFHTFNDNQEWLQIDKMGHAFSAYTISKWGQKIWQNEGCSYPKSIWLGGLSGIFYQTTIEVLDGFSSQWGWSWGDILSNIAGSGFFILQEQVWQQQKIQFKTSFHKKTYPIAALNERSNHIFGTSLPERLLKDYNGQTYWLSVNVKSFQKKSSFPEWLNIAVGTSAEGLFGARNNVAKDNNGNIIFDGSQYTRYREWYLAPDIDFTKIKTNKKSIKLLLFVLNSLKLPAPALTLSKGKIIFQPIYF